MTPNNFLKVLGKYSQQAQKLVKDSLTKNNRIATGKLLNSIHTEISQNNDTYSVTLNFEDYFKYVSEGRKAGKMPPVDSILEWIKVKHILPRPMDGKLPTEKGLAYLIARKIGREGYEGSNDYETSIEQLNNEYIPKLEEALQKDLYTYSMQLFEKLQ